MEYRRLGKSGLQLSVLSFGSWVTFHGQVDDSLSDRLMGIAYDNGVNFFDNAEIYALGESEKMMGRVLKKKNWDRTSYTVSSKAYFGWRGADNKPNQTGLSRKHLVEACHEALQRLQVDYLDLYFCHRPDRNTPVEEVVWTMNILIQQGKILYWGTSEWTAAEIMEAHMIARQYNLIGPVMEQPEYNLFRREKMEMEYLPVFRTVGLGTTIFSPLASGLLTGKYNKGIPEGSRLGLEGYEWLKNRNLLEGNIQKVVKLQEVADRLNTSLATLSVAWCIRNPNVTTAILGATKEAQLTENLKAVEVVGSLTDAVMQEIDGIMQTAPHAPTH
ncbi:potassium channel beta subunit family protein [Chitinophaga cymbidii]|uniref:NADP-dependent aryl-alcohol dehydrogenase n=1 Tax=Chitinophaga cymbidii TaxID=1096750 RepID=A0A512RGR0_9BACT|nr:aldo/keto reductase [Chitinophaga cymbidii]GEP94889.1 NADP-dependent aryl-alcohol dehydrogenase [Chitinophaga cymbidii]